MSMQIWRTVAATAAGLLCGTVQAQSSVTLYGLVDAGVDFSKAGGGTQTRLISGGSFGSRVGFRGAEDLGGGNSAVFRLESGINIDTGSYAQGGLAFGREASVGLASSTLGTVTLGRLPTPYYMVQSAVDAFLWVGSGGLTAITRSGTTSQQLLPQAVNARADNALNYVSPKLGNVEVRALVAKGEGSTTIGNARGLSVRYAREAVDLLAGYGRQEGANGQGGVTSVVVGGSYNFGPARVFAGYTSEKNSCGTCTGILARPEGVAGGSAAEFRLINLGVRVPLGSATAIAQVVRVQDRSQYAVATPDRDATWVAVGGEYALSKRTAFYATLGMIGNRNGSQYALGSGTVQQSAKFVAAGNPRSTTLSLGMRHVF